MTRVVKYDVAFSFAGEDRLYVEQVARLLRSDGVEVFYDTDQQSVLWGKNLVDTLSDVYCNQSFFVILFISKHYKEKMWTNLERRSAQSRALQEKREYVLTVRFDDTEIPGVLPTEGYLSLNEMAPVDLVKMIKEKLVEFGRTVPSSSNRRATRYSTSPRMDPIQSSVTVLDADGNPVQRAQAVAIADNGTFKRAETDESGVARLTITTQRRYRLLVANPSSPASLYESWSPLEDLTVCLRSDPDVGSIIIDRTGYVPGIEGRLNPIHDDLGRTYLYADGITVDGKINGAANFKVGEPFELEDSNGVISRATVLFIEGGISLLEFDRVQ